MTGGGSGRVLASGRDRGSGFAITDWRALTAGHVAREAVKAAETARAGGVSEPVLVCVVDRGEPAMLPAAVTYQPEDGEPIAVSRIEISTRLDVAVLHLKRPAPAMLPVAEEITEGAEWKVITRPGPSDPALGGTVDEPRRRMWNEGGRETTLLQLWVKQQVGDYHGYSGSPVLAPGGGVMGVQVEQGYWRTSRLGEPRRVANVLYAASIDLVLTEFGLGGLTVTRPVTGPRVAPMAGVPLAEATDPFALEVHRPVEPDVPQPGLPALPVCAARS